MDVPSSTMRKRVNTYGKARKARTSQQISNDTLFDSPKGSKIVSAYAHAARIPKRIPSRSPTSSSGHSTPVKSPSHGAHGDLYDVPQSDGERIDKYGPRKRRKVLPRPTVVYTEILQHAQDSFLSPAETKKPATTRLAQKVPRPGTRPAHETMASGIAQYSDRDKDVEEPSRPVAKSGMISIPAIQHSWASSSTTDQGVSCVTANGRDYASIPSPNQNKDVEVSTFPAYCQHSANLDGENKIVETVKHVLHNPTLKIIATKSQKPARSPAALKQKLMRLHELLDDSPESKSGHTEVGVYTAPPVSSPQQYHGSPRRQRLIDSLDSPSKLPKPRFTSLRTTDDDNSVQFGLRQNPRTSKPFDSEAVSTLSSDNVVVDTPVTLQPMAESNLADTQSQSSALAGSRLTYGQQRTMLMEEDLEKLAFETPLIDMSTPVPKNQKSRLPWSEETADMTTEDCRVGIRSLHELRQSGVTSRFADEVEDLFDQIGTPSTSPSLRRAALLDLATKLNTKAYYEMSKALAIEQRLFLHLGQETDVISGFLIMSILWLVLDDGINPTTVVQLRRQGITRLIIRQLQHHEDVGMIAKDRKTNMSKHSTITLIEHKNILGAKTSWGRFASKKLSPRTLALYCLERMVRQCRQAGDTNDLISRELMRHLFELLDLEPTMRDGSYSDVKSGIDFHLALSALESHSLKGIAVSDEASWVEQNLPILRDTLRIILQHATTDDGDLQMLALRLTLNVTNNSKHASEIFTAPELLSCLVNAITTNFRKMSQFLVEEEQLAAVDHLVLLLGVMINFTEWSAVARQFFSDKDNEGSNALNELVQIFITNADKAFEADSVEDSHRNVVLGYLSVLLGYICLSPDAARLVRRYLDSSNLQCLVDSVEDFISHHKKVDDMFENDADGHNSHAGLTSRLQAMMFNLRAMERSTRL